MTLRSSIASLGRRASRISCSSASRFCREQRALFARHVAHLRIGRGVGDHVIDICELGDGMAVRLHLLDHRRDLGELAGELDIGLRRQLAGQLRLERSVARQHDVELGFGKHERIKTLERDALGLGEGHQRVADRAGGVGP